MDSMQSHATVHPVHTMPHADTTAPRVFVVEPPERMDLEATKSYGRLTFLFPDGDAPSPFDGNQLLVGIARRLAIGRYDPSLDLIAIVGPQLHAALLLTVAVARHRKVLALMYHARDRVYARREIFAPDLPGQS